MEVRTILWPTDLSPGSLKASGHVLSLAEKYGALVVVMYVSVDLCSYFPAYGNYPSPDLIQEFQGWEVEQAKAKLEHICGEALKGCPRLKVRLVAGEPAAEILKAIDAEKADLVVMTSRGHGLQARPGGETGLGRVAREILERAKVPVHIVRP